MTTSEYHTFVHLSINGSEFIAIYNGSKDNLTVRRFTAGHLPTHKMPKVFETEGFQEFCENDGCLNFHGMVYDKDEEMWTEREYTVTMIEYMQYHDEFKESVLKFIEQNHAELF